MQKLLVQQRRALCAMRRWQSQQCRPGYSPTAFDRQGYDQWNTHSKHQLCYLAKLEGLSLGSYVTTVLLTLVCIYVIVKWHERCTDWIVYQLA